MPKNRIKKAGELQEKVLLAGLCLQGYSIVELLNHFKMYRPKRGVRGFTLSNSQLKEKNMGNEFLQSHRYFLFSTGTDLKEKVYNTRKEAEAAMH